MSGSLKSVLNSKQFKNLNCFGKITEKLSTFLRAGFNGPSRQGFIKDFTVLKVIWGFCKFPSVHFHNPKSSNEIGNDHHFPA